MTEDPVSRRGRFDPGARPRWTAGYVAEILGISPVTLRSWDSRYGLGPSVRKPGQQRRYSDSDVERLKRVRRLTAEGMRIREAAQWVLSAQEDIACGTGTTTELRHILAEAAVKLRTRLAVAWSAAGRTAKPSLVKLFRDRMVPLCLAGPGWDSVTVPGAPPRVNDLNAATAVIESVDPGGLAIGRSARPTTG